jgi:subtilase-type serine protease
MLALLIAIIASASIITGASSLGGGGGSGEAKNNIKTESSPSYTKNDAEYYQTDEYKAQYGLEQIKAAEAYAFLASEDKPVAGDDVKLAITDTGVKLTHQEISANNSGLGYDFDNDDSNVTDSDGHGTHVASIAAGVKDGKGMHGVAYNSSIMPIQMLGDSSEYGIKYAADNGAGVVNMSWGFVDSDNKGLKFTIGEPTYNLYYNAMKSEFDAAIDSNSGLGTVLVASAGNNSYADNVGTPA